MTGPRIGRRLRELRQARGLTAGDLATKADLTPGFISQLERDLTSASLASLARISDALGVTMGYLIEGSPGVSVLRREEQPLAKPGYEGQEHRFLATRERRFNATRSRIAPAAGPGEGLYTFPADVELVYVLAGALELTVGAQVVTVRAGETFTYSPREAHTWRNPSTRDETVVLWFAVPNPYSTR
jgi:transcriptional regulator with XRE-family HTH domain